MKAFPRLLLLVLLGSPAGAQAPAVGEARAVEAASSESAPETTVWSKEAAQRVFDSGARPSVAAVLGGWKVIAVNSPADREGQFNPAGVVSFLTRLPSLYFVSAENPLAKPRGVLAALTGYGDSFRCLSVQEQRSLSCADVFGRTLDCRQAGPEHLICLDGYSDSADKTAFIGFARDPQAPAPGLAVPWSPEEAAARFAESARPGEEHLIGEWRLVAETARGMAGHYRPGGAGGYFGDAVRLALSRRVRHPLDGGLNTMKIEVNLGFDGQPRSYAFESGALVFAQELSSGNDGYYNDEPARIKFRLDFRCRLADDDHLLCEVTKTSTQTPGSDPTRETLYYGFARTAGSAASR